MRTGQLMRRCQQPRMATRATPATLVATTPNGRNRPNFLVFALIVSSFPGFIASTIASPTATFPSLGRIAVERKSGGS